MHYRKCLEKNIEKKGKGTSIFRGDLCEIPVAMGISLWEFHIWV